jgi:hypothetical protein
VRRMAHAQCLAELDLYGLGRARSLEEFQQHTGVEFKTRQMSDKVPACVINPACVCVFFLALTSRRVAGKVGWAALHHVC